VGRDGDFTSRREPGEGLLGGDVLLRGYWTVVVSTRKELNGKMGTRQSGMDPRPVKGPKKRLTAEVGHRPLTGPSPNESMSGVAPTLNRARNPRGRNTLSEAEALNWICDARENEPTCPLKRLLREFNWKP
jgi:hypothetical protein